MLGAEIFPDVELTVCTYLRSALAARVESYCSGVHVSNDLPTPRPTRAVIVRHAGGRRTGHVTAIRTIGVNVWAATEQDATDLSRMVAALLCSAAPSPIEHVEELSAPTPVPDESGTPRRYGTFALTVTPTHLT